jgi:glycosyltransferase involved in cell wall biosynthesis
MRILILANSLADTQAGAAQHMLDLAVGLASRNRSPGQVCVYTSTPSLPQCKRIDIICHRPPKLLRFLWRFHKFYELHRVVSEMRRHPLPEVDFCFTANPALGLSYRKLVANTPIVSHVGSVIASREHLDESWPNHAWHVRLNAHLADRLEARSYRAPRWMHLASTPTHARVREEHYGLPSGFFRVCPLGVNYEKLDRTVPGRNVRKEFRIPDSAFVLTTVCRLKWFKNVEMIIHALARMRDPGAHLIVVGDGPEKGRLLEAARSCGVADRTRFAGHTANPAPFYAAGDVFVLPSLLESFGLVYAEAMFLRLPCIGMRHDPPKVLSSAQDVIPEGKAGYCISTSDELADRLEFLRANPDARVRMGEYGHSHALRHYTIDHYIESMLNLAHQDFGITV